MVEYGNEIEGKVKAMKSEIKENVQGTYSDRKKTSAQINGLEQKEEINIQPEQNEDTRIQKNEERLRDLQDNINCSNIQIVQMPEGEGEEQEIENFPKLAKEIDMQVQEAQRVPKKLNPRRNTPSTL